METWGVGFLGVIALGSLVQTATLVAAFIYGRRLTQRVDALQTRLEAEIKPAIDDLRRATQNVSEMSERAVEQVRRLDTSITETVTRIEDTVADVRRAVLRPLGPLGDFLAVIKGFRRGFEVYQRLSGVDDDRRAESRRYRDDEHLFI
jgi:hypothetical protein